MLQKTGHWTDNHIRFDSNNMQFVAYDEAALEYGKFNTQWQARDALVHHAEQLDKANVEDAR